jgi:hypothetical protein
MTPVVLLWLILFSVSETRYEPTQTESDANYQYPSIDIDFNERIN